MRRGREARTTPGGPAGRPDTGERGTHVTLPRQMAQDGVQVVRLEFMSAFEMLDFVQVASDHMGRLIGLDEDAIHWVGVSLRESVINAIKHGNRNDARKRVFVELAASGRLDHATGGAAELVIRVRDEGRGFDPGMVESPLEPENLLKASGRGIFIIRSFMDVVDLYRAPEGGMEIRMVKRAHPVQTVPPAGESAR